MDIDYILNFLWENWEILKAAPWVFVFLVVVACVVTFYVVRYLYRDRVETLKMRLAAKDDQLADYRQRLRLTPAPGTAYSRLSNAELQHRALRLVTNIRRFLVQVQKQSGIVAAIRFHTLSEEERERAWHDERDEVMQQSLHINAEYESRFKMESILLRDELLSRLPPEAKKEREYRTYELPTNPIGMDMVANELERLARSLPSQEG